MMYLKYQKKLIEITDEQAQRAGELLDKNRKIPFGLERLDPMKCEIIKDLPVDWRDYEIIEQQVRLEAPKHDYSYIKRTPEEQKRTNETLDNMRKELSEKLGWKNNLNDQGVEVRSVIEK